MKLMHIISSDEYYITHRNSVAVMDGWFLYTELGKLLRDFINKDVSFKDKDVWTTGLDRKFDQRILFTFDSKDDIKNEFAEYLI